MKEIIPIITKLKKKRNPLSIKLKMSLASEQKYILILCLSNLCMLLGQQTCSQEATFVLHIFQSTQEGRGAEKEMHALWVSLKDNVKCGNKINDVIKQPAKCGKGSCYAPAKEKMDEYNRPLMETTTSQVVSRPCNTLVRLHGKLLSCTLLLFL